MNRLVAPHNDYRTGDWRTGDWQTGDWQTGNWRLGRGAPERQSPGQLVPPLASATVVVPVYNRLELLQRTIAGLSAQTIPTPVIVVDDGSTENVEAALTGLDNNLDLIVVRQDRDGYGAGRARNRGAAMATTDVLIFVDADCIPAPDLVERHVAHHRWENLSVIGRRKHIRGDRLDLELLTEGSASFDKATVDDGASDFRTTLIRRTSGLTSGTEAYRSFVSSNVSVNRAHFLEAGGFSEDFTRWGGEDTELGWRLEQMGGFFIPADGAIVYHQVDLDGPEGWRRTDRHQNDGLITSKIPHRFYRRRGGVLRNQVPKVSFVVWPLPQSDLQTLAEEILSSNLRDIEMILVGDPASFEPFTGAATGDSRVRFVMPGSEDPLAAGIRETRGELVISLHGDVAPDRRMAARLSKRLDDRPRISSATVGYRVIDAASGLWVDHLRSDDPAIIDAGWARTVPLAAVARRRDWSRVLSAGLTSAEGWQTIRAWDIADHISQPLVWLPGNTSSVRPSAFRVANQDRESVKSLLQKRQPIAAAKRGAALVRRRPPPRLIKAPPTKADPSKTQSERADLRYVGWTGRDNLGDEAMLRAVRHLLPWADISTAGDPADGLVLGGGTLINRTTYLRWLQERDSPRVERMVFGTGVASPSFWGITEDIDGWLDYLASCVFVGVRGPASLETLRSWGYQGDVKVIGDPALALLPETQTAKVQGKVIVSPAWTKGELWGGDDAAVYAVLTAAVKMWLNEGRQVELFSCHPDDDRPCIEIMRSAGRPDLPHHFGYLDIDRSLKTLASAEIVVAERLHAAVLAATVETAFVSLEYRPKLADFARSVDAEQWLVRTDEISAGALVELVEAAPNQRPAVQIRTEEYRTLLRDAAISLEQAVLR